MKNKTSDEQQHMTSHCVIIYVTKNKANMEKPWVTKKTPYYSVACKSTFRSIHFLYDLYQFFTLFF